MISWFHCQIVDYSTATARLQFEPEPQSTYLTCAQYLGEKYICEQLVLQVPAKLVTTVLNPNL